MPNDILAAPIELTDAELDAVAGGLLDNVTVVDVVDVNDNQVQLAVPVNAAVAAAAFDSVANATATQPGNINQGRGR